MVHSEKIIFHHLNDFYNIDVIQGINVGRQFSKHSHSSICLGVINRGTRKCLVGKKEIQVESGKVFVINKGEAHSVTSLDKNTHDYMCLCFEIASIDKISSVVFFDNIIDDLHLYMLINRLCSNLLNSSLDLENEGLFIEIIEKLTVNYSSSTGNFKKLDNEQKNIKLLKQYIDDNYKDNISIIQLSEISGLSSFYLIRLFTSEYGFAPHCYQNNIRMKRVKQLLMEGEMTMSDIALEVGFSDQSHMIRHFKKIVGIVPSHYLKEMRK